MTNNYFWQIPQCKKFRIIFEDDEMVIGEASDREYQTFRKDSQFIGFSEQEALEQSLGFLATKEIFLGEPGHLWSFSAS
jgi:hypothetical protein